MGAVQFLFPENNQDMISQAQKYAEEGLRVLVLAHSPEKSEGTELPKKSGTGGIFASDRCDP